MTNFIKQQAILEEYDMTEDEYYDYLMSVAENKCRG